MTKTCPICGKDFMTTAPAKKYCSTACMKSAQHKQQQDWRLRHPKAKGTKDVHVWKALLRQAKTAPCGWYPTCFDCEEPDCTYKGR